MSRSKSKSPIFPGLFRFHDGGFFGGPRAPFLAAAYRSRLFFHFTLDWMIRLPATMIR